MSKPLTSTHDESVIRTLNPLSVSVVYHQLPDPKLEDLLDNLQSLHFLSTTIIAAVSAHTHTHTPPHTHPSHPSKSLCLKCAINVWEKNFITNVAQEKLVLVKIENAAHLISIFFLSAKTLHMLILSKTYCFVIVNKCARCWTQV